MKCFTVVSLALLGSAHAYTMPTMATRAVGRKKIGAAAAKAAPAEKPAKKTIGRAKIVAGTKVVKKPAAAKKVAAKPVKKVASKPVKKAVVKKVATKPAKAAKPVKKAFVRPTPVKKAAPAKKDCRQAEVRKKNGR